MDGVTVRLLPDPDQHATLVATLERVNRVSNAVRAAALDVRAQDPKALRAIVAEQTERQKLPAAFNRPVTERVAAALARRGGRAGKFTTYQSLTFPAGSLKWPGTDRVTLPTAAGRRTIPVHVDRSRGDLRPPLEGRATTLVFANGEFSLTAAES